MTVLVTLYERQTYCPQCKIRPSTLSPVEKMGGGTFAYVCGHCGNVLPMPATVGARVCVICDRAYKHRDKRRTTCGAKCGAQRLVYVKRARKFGHFLQLVGTFALAIAPPRAEERRRLTGDMQCANIDEQFDDAEIATNVGGDA